MKKATLRSFDDLILRQRPFVESVTYALHRAQQEAAPQSDPRLRYVTEVSHLGEVLRPGHVFGPFLRPHHLVPSRFRPVTQGSRL